MKAFKEKVETLYAQERNTAMSDEKLALVSKTDEERYDKLLRHKENKDTKSHCFGGQMNFHFHKTRGALTVSVPCVLFCFYGFCIGSTDTRIAFLFYYIAFALPFDLLYDMDSILFHSP